MASNTFISVEKLVTCNLCSRIYDDPRLLPCSHTYCFPCINQLISTNKSDVICRSCHESKILPNDLNCLPSNQILGDIVQLYLKMQHPPLCSNCERSVAEYICHRCPNDYCSECFQIVHQPRALQNHQKISINQKSSEILRCDKHPDEKRKHWCKQCHVAVCSDCLLNEHQGHSFHLIHQAAKELEIQIKTDLEMIQSSLNEEIEEANVSLNDIQIKSELNKRKVHQTMKYLREIIDEHEKQMLEDIENFQREETEQMKTYQNQLENQLKYSHFHQTALNFFLSINDQMKLLKNQLEFLHYINQTKENLSQLIKPIEIDYHLTGLEQLHYLKEQILQCATVTEISKQIFPISIIEQPRIEKFISQYQTKEDLDFSKQCLTDENIYLLIQLLKTNMNIITLNLSNNQIGPQGVQPIVDILQYNQTLTKFDLSNNEISDEGAKYLANALKINTTLTTLYLYDNGISEKGTAYFTDALQTNTTLTVLDLQSNRINHRGAQYIADTLRTNNTLTTLYLSNNQIGNQGAQYLADALQQNKTLTALTLSDNQIDHEAKRRVIEILKSHPRLAIYW